MRKSTRKNSLNERARTAGNGRHAERQPGTELAVPSESNLENATAAPPSSKAQVSFFITKAQKAQLREKGYSDDQIAQMKPAEAHRILGLE
jgi:hypothetical protein